MILTRTKKQIEGASIADASNRKNSAARVQCRIPAWHREMACNSILSATRHKQGEAEDHRLTMISFDPGLDALLCSAVFASNIYHSTSAMVYSC